MCAVPGHSGRFNVNHSSSVAGVQQEGGNQKSLKLHSILSGRRASSLRRGSRLRRYPTAASMLGMRSIGSGLAIRFRSRFSAAGGFREGARKAFQIHHVVCTLVWYSTKPPTQATGRRKSISLVLDVVYQGPSPLPTQQCPLRSCRPCLPGSLWSCAVNGFAPLDHTSASMVLTGVTCR